MELKNIDGKTYEVKEDTFLTDGASGTVMPYASSLFNETSAAVASWPKIKREVSKK